MVRGLSLHVDEGAGPQAHLVVPEFGFDLMVPELWSTALSTNTSRPWSVPRSSGSVARTGARPDASAASTSGRSRCGSVKATAIGSSCVIVTSGGELGCT